MAIKVVITCGCINLWWFYGSLEIFLVTLAVFCMTYLQARYNNHFNGAEGVYLLF